MLNYFKNPLLAFCVVGLVVYGLITYYNNTQCNDDSKKRFTTNEMYMYSSIIASLASGILYVTTKTSNEEVTENNFERLETLQNRPVVDKVSEVDKKQFFDSMPNKSHRNKPKNIEKIMTDPFEQ